MAGVKFSVNTDGIKAIANRLVYEAPKAEHGVAIQVAKDTEDYVPMLTGSLKNRTLVQGGTIIYPGPYARFLYYGKVMVDPNTGSTWSKKGETKVPTEKDLDIKQTHHKNAQSHWFEASKAENLDKWIRAAQKAVTKFGDQ